MTSRPRLEYARALIERQHAAIRSDDHSLRALISVTGPIDQKLETSVRRAIARAAGRVDGMNMLVDSPGGDMAAARRIVRDIRQCGTPAMAVAGLAVESAATMVYAAAQRRVARPASRFFFHTSSVNISEIDLCAADAKMLRQVAATLDGLDIEALFDLMARARFSAPMVAAMRTNRGLTIGAPLAQAIELVNEVPRLPPELQFRALMLKKAPLALLRRTGLAT